MKKAFFAFSIFLFLNLVISNTSKNLVYGCDCGPSCTNTLCSDQVYDCSAGPIGTFDGNNKASCDLVPACSNGNCCAEIKGMIPNSIFTLCFLKLAAPTPPTCQEGKNGCPCHPPPLLCDDNLNAIGTGSSCVCSELTAPTPAPCPEGSSGCFCRPGGECDPGLEKISAGYCLCMPKKLDEATCIPASGGFGLKTAIGCIPIDPPAAVRQFLTLAIGIGGGIAFILMLFGSFQIMASGGDPKSIQAGKELITATLIGILLVIFSVFLLKLVGIDILGIPGL